jgi:predicted alpha/beta superfamily hydrolase
MLKLSLALFALMGFAWAKGQMPSVDQGTLVRHQVKSAYVDQRYVDVWLPPGYRQEKKYPVIYMHDGQMLYDGSTTWNKQEWNVDAKIGSMMNNGMMPECIIAGIWNNQEKRHAEYFPEKAIALIPDSQKGQLMPLLKGGPQADAYLLFLVKEVKPLIDRLYSTKPEQESTFICGSSMGGLISLYAVCEYPEVYGGAACLSTHWPGIFTMESNPIPDALLAYLSAQLPLPTNHKLYFDHGTATLDSLYKPTQMRVDSLLRQRGYSVKNLLSLEFPGEAHTEEAWSSRLPIPFAFLLKK